MSISSVDHRIIGLSPQYWTHTPLLIGDLVSLPLINGVDCFISRTSLNVEPQIVPLSKVVLHGIVTAVDRRPGGCILLVLDDGTGSIDIRCWDETFNRSGAYDLMGLQEPVSFTVGDYCEVLGKIRAMTAGAESMCGLGAADGEQFDVRVGCIREVHASSVCRTNESRNAEVVHWLKCLSFTRDVQQGTIKTGKDMLPLLSDSIVSSILTDSAIEPEAGNIFERRCCQTPQRFRQALFYCHCEGTLDALDPSFRYRDALLNKLLNMEEGLQHLSQSAYAESTEDCIDLIGGQADEMPPPLLFSFELIYKDNHLSTLASELVASTPVPETNARQLVQNTFRAMTKDGLISLFDTAADVYLLLSVDRVMEPYLLSVSNAGSSMALPFFIRSVTKSRMNRIRGWVEKNRRYNAINTSSILNP